MGDYEDKIALRVEELDPLGTRVVWPSSTQEERSVWVLAVDGEWRVYENLCPHWRCPLDVRGGAVVLEGRASLRCDVHGAEFRRSDGVCEDGPCAGDRLKRLDAWVDGEWLMVSEGLSRSLRLYDSRLGDEPRLREE